MYYSPQVPLSGHAMLDWLWVHVSNAYNIGMVYLKKSCLDFEVFVLFLTKYNRTNV